MTNDNDNGKATDSFAGTAFRLTALMGLLGVGLGAFGAHGLEGVLEKHGHVDTWDTAVFYHLTHTAVLLVLATMPGSFRRGAWMCFFIGILIFSGSLYVLSLTDIRILGAITPIGGVLMLAGWAWLLIAGLKRS